MTVSSVRLELLQVLEELSALCSDVRFGQLIANLSYLAESPTNEAVWDVSDEKLLQAAKQQLKDLADRHLHSH